MTRARPTIAGCGLLTIRGAADPRGRINFVETGTDLAFPLNRAFWIHGVPAGQDRGHHAHRQAQLMIIALSGAVDLVLDDGRRRETFRLDSPDLGMLVGTMVWHELRAFAAGTVVLVLASTAYAESDYIRDYATFRSEAGVQDTR
jgi:dTDP-4-dehydrorhamnose 3,5-epimerase-like enzyme